MGNGCACQSEHYTSNKIFIKRNVINKILDIDIDFCKLYSIGPFFEHKRNDSGTIKQILKLINYKDNSIDINILYSFDNYINLRNIIRREYNKKNLVFMNNSVFRSLFYLIILETIPFDINCYDLVLKDNMKNMNLEKQIDNDIPRTFPTIPLFKNEIFLNNLRENLVNIAFIDKEIGYVQGINFVVGFIGMLCGNDRNKTLEMFFKIMNMKSKIFDLKFKEVITTEFKLLFMYFERIKLIMKRINNKLENKISSLQLNEFIYLSKWIQTLFIYNFEFYIVLRLWDILVHDIDLIILICISILEYNSKEILKVNDIEGFIKVINNSYNIAENKKDKFLNFIINFIKKYMYLL